MKKIITATIAGTIAFSLAMPAFAANGAMMNYGMKESAASKMMKKNVDGACMATAVSKRDTAIATELQKVVDAVKKRGSDSSAAWTASDKTALQNAKKAFDGSWKTFNTARKAAWSTFNTESKTCKNIPGMEKTDMPTGEAGL